MATIKLSADGKVLLKDGKATCTCCETGTCQIEWETELYDEFDNPLNTGQLEGNPWVVSLGGSRIRVNVEDSENCDCTYELPGCTSPAVNTETQTAYAQATITAPPDSDVSLGFSFSGVAEEEASGFENIVFILNGTTVASATSPGTIGGNTCEMGPAVPTYFVPPPYVLPAGSVNTLEIYFTTGDPLYHVGAYYQADFTCELIPTE
jgi:hypothetical protein